MTVSRRTLLKESGLLAAMSALPRWLPRLAFAQPYNNPAGDVLIVVFLRGGADALNMIVPHGDEAYYAARPALAIPRPDQSGTADKTIDLDGFFGLHPALAPLQELFQAGTLKAIHATGSPHGNRSHFEAMNYVERGTPDNIGLSTGWIGRHLATLDTNNNSPIRGIGWGTALQTALVGAPSAVAMQSIVDYHLGGNAQLAEQMMAPLMELYTMSDESLAASAQSTQAAIDVVQSVDYLDYVPQHNASYPESDFGLALRQIAALVRADVGLEVACVDLGGWDTHANQGGTDGTHAALLTDLAQSLTALHQDMGPEMNRVSVVVMSEFGRRLMENANNGTDHGSGGAMLLMGDNFTENAPVIAQWPGLELDALVNGEDLAITIDYRNVLGELLKIRLNNPGVDAVFPDYAGNDMGLFRT
jgi:uncharacterized protein (DUF1501 family)